MTRGVCGDAPFARSIAQDAPSVVTEHLSDTSLYWGSTYARGLRLDYFPAEIEASRHGAGCFLERP